MVHLQDIDLGGDLFLPTENMQGIQSVHEDLQRPTRPTEPMQPTGPLQPTTPLQQGPGERSQFQRPFDGGDFSDNELGENFGSRGRFRLWIIDCSHQRYPKIGIRKSFLRRQGSQHSVYTLSII